MHDVVIIESGQQSENLAALRSKLPHARVVQDSLWQAMADQVKLGVTAWSWILSDSCDYSDFDFAWQPAWHQSTHLHAWPTEPCARTANTFLMRRELLEQEIDTNSSPYTCKNFNSDHPAVRSLATAEIFIVDHGVGVEALTAQFPQARVFRRTGTWQAVLRRIARHAAGDFWVVSSYCSYKDFDFAWRPEWDQQHHLHVWPTHNQQHSGDTFFVSKLLDFDAALINSDHNPVPLHASWPVLTVGDSSMRRFGSRGAQISRACKHVQTPWFWFVDAAVHTEDFDWSWRPEWSEEKNLHVWATAKQKHGGDVILVNRQEFLEQQPTDLLHYQNITWHSSNNIKSKPLEVFILDMGAHDANVQAIQQRWPSASVLRYHGSHLSMLRKIATHASGTHVWIASSCCDYSNFDWDWRPDWHNENHLHCWASGDQKFGDTFLLPVAAFRSAAADLQKLEYFNSVEWHSSGVARLPWPENYSQTDLFSTVKNHKFHCVYEWFIMPGSTRGSDVDPCIWENRSLIAYNKNGHVSLVPRDAKTAISTKILDYHYIQYQNCEKSTEKPQDIVFISYDEKNADLRWQQLVSRYPRARRVHGVSGMAAAFQAAALHSSTPWFYFVPARVELVPEFDFEHRPNYLQTPGHVIFHAHNPVLGIQYGHGAIKLLHRQTVLDLQFTEQDFVLSSHVDVVPILSCINHIDESDWSAWRTAFREASKLQQQDNIESRYRLHCWLTAKHRAVAQAAALAMRSCPTAEQLNDWDYLRQLYCATKKGIL